MILKVRHKQIVQSEKSINKFDKDINKQQNMTNLSQNCAQSFKSSGLILILTQILLELKSF